MSAKSNIKSLFKRNRSSTLNTFQNNGDLVEYLGITNDEICDKIDDKLISISRIIGKGKYGSVFDILVIGMSRKKYVVKKTKTIIEIINVNELSFPKSTTLGDYYYYISMTFPNPLSKTIFIKANGGDEDVSLSSLETIVIPSFAETCKITSPVVYTINDGSNANKVFTKSDGHICKNNTYTEYIISLIVSEIYTSGKCINFLGMLGFATCKSKEIPQFSQYIFMEKISRTLKSIISESISEEDMASIIIQVTFAIGMMGTLGVSHNDLHTDNIFLDEIVEGYTYNNSILSECDAFHYVYNTKSIYFPRGKYIVKIGDFGLAGKFSVPIIIPMDLLKDRYNPPIPNWFSEKYDLSYFIRKFVSSTSYDSEILSNVSLFIDKDYTRAKYIQPHLERPRLDTMEYHNSKPENLLDFIASEYDMRRNVYNSPVTLGEY